MDTKQAEGKSSSRSSDPRLQRADGSAPAKNRIGAAEPKSASGSTTKEAARPSRRSARPTSKAERLVCRYCGSDDLAPSFKKRGDARCRACFKKRYGSTAKNKRTPQTGKVKATK